jgi:hypothetical protein
MSRTISTSQAEIGIRCSYWVNWGRIPHVQLGILVLRARVLDGHAAPKKYTDSISSRIPIFRSQSRNLLTPGQK